MKFLVVLAVALACAAADISEILKNEASAPITKQSYDISPEGSYKYAYETANGIAAQQSGNFENTETGPSEVINGGYRFFTPDGASHETTYVADKNGYQPSSADIPVPPPVPEAILRALAWIAANPQPTKQ